MSCWTLPKEAAKNPVFAAAGRAVGPSAVYHWALPAQATFAAQTIASDAWNFEKFGTDIEENSDENDSNRSAHD